MERNNFVTLLQKMPKIIGKKQDVSIKSGRTSQSTQKLILIELALKYLDFY
jgi:hypothetical protein